jgi:hypothetical protein
MNFLLKSRLFNIRETTIYMMNIDNFSDQFILIYFSDAIPHYRTFDDLSIKYVLGEVFFYQREVKIDSLK